MRISERAPFCEFQLRALGNRFALWADEMRVGLQREGAGSRGVSKRTVAAEGRLRAGRNSETKRAAAAATDLRLPVFVWTPGFVFGAHFRSATAEQILNISLTAVHDTQSSLATTLLLFLFTLYIG